MNTRISKLILPSMLALAAFNGCQRPVRDPQNVQASSRKELTLYHQGLTSVPDSVWRLINLEELSVMDNELTAIDPRIGGLAKLKVLNLSENNLTRLPDEICALRNLEVLDLKSNRLESLPECIGQLKNLRKLYLWGSGLAAQEDQIKARLPKCEVIYEGDI